MCMKWIICICLVFCSSFMGEDGSSTGLQTWIVEKNSTLLIEGSSNINQFACDVRKYLHCDTLTFATDAKVKRLHFQCRTVHIDVSEIDCHHKFITADLRRTLQHQQYPFMKIHFVSLDDPFAIRVGQPLNGIVEIELAGSIRRVEMSFVVKSHAGRLFHLSGSKNLVFSDFNLEPPKKLAGLIRINDDLKVTVQLFFRKIG